MFGRGLVVFSLSLAGSISANAQTPQQIEFFEKSVRPLLTTHCVECHGASEKKIRGGLRLTTRAELLKGGDTGPAISPGKPEESLLVKGLHYTSDDLKMPPKGKLPAADIAVFTKWVKDGAAWPESGANANTGQPKPGQLFTEEQRKFWAFQPVTDSPEPTVKNVDWVKNPVDAFILSKLETKGLTPAKPADRRTLIRRVTYDLTGLPPTPQEILDFVDDNSAHAWEHVVDRLLRSTQYGESQARHWLDIARYADSNGLDENTAFANAFRYRDYVIKSFNEDKPYDLFIKEQIAGDLLPDANTNPDRITGTGFLVLGPKLLAEPDKQKMKLDIADEQVDTLGKAFLGLTLGCARCHDHKFDPIPTRDYYGLLGIFTSTRTMKNLSTVAAAYERSLPTGESPAVAEARAKKIAAKEAEVQQITKELRERLLREAKERAGEYLLAAADAKGTAGVARMGQTKDNPPGTVVLEAEKYSTGTADKDTNALGKGIGIIYSLKPENNKATLSLSVPKTGDYELELRYASLESRPIRISVNGKLVLKEAAKATTGGWNPEHQTWRAEGSIPLNQGKNTISIEGVGLLPHLDKIAVMPPLPTGKNGSGRASAGSVPDVGIARKLIPEFITGWTEYLKRKKEDPFFAPWLAVRDLPDEGFAEASAPILAKFTMPKEVLEGPPAKTLAEFAKKYQQALTGSETGKKILAEANGPYALKATLPANPEAFYPAELATISSLNGEIVAMQKLAPPTIAVLAVEEGAKYGEVRADGKPRSLFVQIRGSYLTPGEEAPAVFPRILAGESQSPVGGLSMVSDIPKHEVNQTKYGHSRSASGRLELANWLADPKNPLPARVMANRIWLHLFGEGIVRSPDNFGKLGERPSHPELLDWLATQFVREGWSIKKLQKTILMSNAYRMSSTHNEAAALADPDNRLLWRFNRRRLEAEKIRDGMLFAAGNIDLKMGGSLLNNGNFSYISSNPTMDASRYDNARRSIYLPIIRNRVFDFFQSFDMAEPHVPNGKRANTVVAPQALYLMNSPFVRQQSEILAAQLLKDHPANVESRVQSAYLRAYGRRPKAEELAEAERFVNAYETALTAKIPDPEKRARTAWAGFCQAIFASSEFIYLN
ncbi:DUF1553 domain-containing protein [Zavarzinella formosa]|uniref:DUF1553 domain-containing protein n=1 Tax=Zavarzinella formosa TaxID=360055 RepID=UPI0002F87070|nr:DUF1553 domain-containing protein [Zavarzinella formosa]